MTIDERAFEKAWEAFNQPRAALIGDFMPRSLRAALEAYEAARAKEPERTMRERLDAVIEGWWAATRRTGEPKAWREELRNAILAELRTPTKGMVDAMAKALDPVHPSCDLALYVWQTGNAEIAKGA